MAKPGGRKYEFGFEPGSPYGHAVDLLRGRGDSTGVVLDLGCGFGAIADPIQDMGLEYVGLDLESAGVESLLRRGHEAYVCDLRDEAELRRILGHSLRDRRVLAVAMLDFLEHLPDSASFIAMLEGTLLGLGQTRPNLLLSVPNVGHFDIAAKLLLGRWDSSQTGLLDETHLSWFTSERLSSALNAAGYREVARKDFSLAASDQAAPWDLPTIAPTTPLSRLLRDVRRRADEFGWINQFVRLYEPSPEHGEATTQPADAKPFMSVIMRTQGTRPQMLTEALLCLSAQTHDDFEVILCVHTDDSPVTALIDGVVAEFPDEFRQRIRILEVRGGSRGKPLNEGVHIAAGSYLGFLDDDDLVTADWVEAFHQRSLTNPGQVLRAVVATQAITAAGRGEYRATAGLERPYPDAYDAVAHLYSNSTPICSYAVPAAAVQSLGLRFDESLVVLEDWDFLLQAANFCGVSDTFRVTSIYHLWAPGQASSAAEPEALWTTCRDSVHATLNDQVILLPRGSASEIASAVGNGLPPERREHLEHEIARLRGETGRQHAEIQWLRSHGLRGLVRDAIGKLRRMGARGDGR